MHIKKLIPGEKIHIYMAGGAIGQGIRGKEENIVEVIWRQNFKGIGMAEFGDGSPVGLPLNDGDIVMMEPINTVKNAFWDAGINVAVLDTRAKGDCADMTFEVLNYGGRKGDILVISVIGDEVFDIDAVTTKIGNKKDYVEMIEKIKKFYKH